MKDIYEELARMFKERSDYYEKAANESESYAVKCDTLARSAAYYSAWTMLNYARQGNWECLNEFDYYGEE